MNLKFYSLAFDRGGHAKLLAYFEVSKKHCDSLEDTDYINEYIVKKVIWRAEPLSSHSFFVGITTMGLWHY